MEVITIGRDPRNDVVISDPSVSRHHLQIIRDDYGNFRLADFGSINGTFVNERRATGEIHLNPGDIIRIGDTVLPWYGYFKVKAERPYAPYAPYSPRPVPDRAGVPAPENRYGIYVLLLGLASLGLNVYIVISYFNSIGYQLAGLAGSMFGGMEDYSLKLFPIYLSGYYGIGGQWIPMISALVLGIVANVVDHTVREKDSLSKAGKGMANMAIGVAVIFLLLALFAEQISLPDILW